MAAFTAAGGVHTITVEKEGFIRFRRDVGIESGKASELTAQLVPSEEFRSAYRERTGLWRRAAWASMGLGVAAMAGAGALYWYSNETSRALRADIAQYNAAAARTVEDESALGRRESELGRLESATVAVAGVGVVGVAAGLLIYLTADDPSRYDGVETAVNVTWMVSPGGGGIILGGSY